MAKQAQPKVSELVEILIQQQLKSDSTNKQISQSVLVLTDIVKNTKFNVDITLIKKSYSEIIKEIYRSNEKQQIQLNTLNNNLNKTVFFPKWLITIFSSFLVLFFLSFSYNFYQHKKIEETEAIAFQNGVNYFKDHMWKFFKEDSNSHKKYQTWDKNFKK